VLRGVEFKMTASRLCCGLLALVLCAVPLALASNGAEAGCLSKSEARKLWPRAHLYWHTEAHCWDASRKSEPSRKSQATAESNQGVEDGKPPGVAARKPPAPPIVALSGDEPPPYAWLDALSWLPMSWQSFESKWDEEIGQLSQPPLNHRFGISRQ
jgi:hypothetical protein